MSMMLVLALDGGKEGEYMATLLDKYDAFLNAYVRKSTSASTSKADEKAFKADDYDFGNKWSSDMKMSPEFRRELALVAPFFMKATKKKNLDRFRSWFEFENINTREPPSKADATIIRLFDNRADPKFKFVIASICADIYGDGFILKKYAGDVTKKVGKKEVIDFELPPPKGAALRNLELMDPENLSEVKYLSEKNARKGKQFKDKGIQHFFYQNKKTGVEMYIHPSRVMHFKDDQLPFSKLGISKVDMLRNIISSEKDIDIATGEILKWFSHGVHEITKEGMQPNERKEVLKQMATHPNFYANSDKWKLKIHNPTAIDPKEFYNYLILAIASVFVMPTQVLLGVQIGKVTGAETGYSDYYRDVKDKQELLDSPQVKQMYTEVFAGYKNSSGKQKEFKYNPVWNDIYVGELAESELLGKRAATIMILMGTNPPIISQEEARQMMNKGVIYLDPSKKIKAPKVVAPVINEKKDKENPIVRKPIKDSEKKPKKASSDVFQLRQEMIDKRKQQEQARLDRAIGDKVIEEQDDLFGKEEK